MKATRRIFDQEAALGVIGGLVLSEQHQIKIERGKLAERTGKMRQETVREDFVCISDLNEDAVTALLTSAAHYTMSRTCTRLEDMI